MNDSKKIKIGIILIIISIVLIDQVTKIVILNHNNQTIGMVTLNYEKKEENNEIFMSVVTDIVILIVIIKFLKEQDKNMDYKVRFSLSCILGGAISNLIDKIWNREVIAFIHFEKLPVLNIAYIVLIIGWVMFAMLMVKSTIKTRAEIKEINQQKAEIRMRKK